jgi:hypothetical protein
MNLLLKGWVLGDRAITRKMTETLHHALRAMMQFSVFFQFDTPSTNKINRYRNELINSLKV